MSSDQPLFVSNVLALNAVSLATTTQSVAIDVKEATNVGIQAIATGASISGTVQMQVSCDGTNWAASSASINLATTPIGATNIALLAFPFVRALFTTAGGTGSVTVYICTKRV